MSDRTLSMTLPGEDGDSTYNYYQLVTENGWYSAESDYPVSVYLGNFEIFDITESDRWGLQRMIPEPNNGEPELAGIGRHCSPPPPLLTDIHSIRFLFKSVA